MGDVAKAIGAIRQAKAAIGSNGADQSDPGAILLSDPLASLGGGGAPNFGGAGQSAAQPMPSGGGGGGASALLDDLFSGAMGPQPDASQPTPAPAAPADNPYTQFDDDPTKDLAQNVGTNEQAPIDIMADDWKPKKESTLGRIADTILQLRGRQPVFEQRTDEKNFETAMPGTQRDPELLIQRVAKFNPELAYKMQQQYESQRRQNANLERQNNVFDLKRDQVVESRVAGILNSVDMSDPEAAKRAVSMAKRYAISKGSQEIADQIPDDLSQLDHDLLTKGFLSVKDQERLKDSDKRIEQKDRSLDQGDKRVDIQRDNVNSQIGRRDHQSATDDQRESRAGKKNESPKVVMTKYGPGQVKGNKMVIVRDGMMHSYLNVNGTWVPQTHIPIKGAQ
jgi:hypothetical protein